MRGVEEVAGLGGLHAHLHTDVRLLPERLKLQGLHGVGLDDPYGCEGFQQASALGDGKAGELFGQHAQPFSAGNHWHQDEGQHATGNEGQLPVDDQHADQDA